MNRSQGIILVLAMITLNFVIIFFTQATDYSLFYLSAIFLLVIMMIEARLMFQFSSKDTNYGETHKVNIGNLLMIALGFSPIVTLFITVFEAYEFLQIPFLLAGLGLGLLFVYLVVAYTTVSITRESDRILCNYYWIRKKEIKYGDIEEIYINKLTNSIVIKDLNGTKVYIDMMLVDLQLILNELYAKVDSEKTVKLFKGLKTFYKGMLLKSNLEMLDAYKEQNSN